MKALSTVLSTTPDELLGVEHSLPPSDELTADFTLTFRQRLLDFLSCCDPKDIYTCCGTFTPYIDILDGSKPLTRNRAVRIAGECGIASSWLFGLSDDPIPQVVIDKPLDDKGYINRSLLSSILMKTLKLSSDEASAKANEYADRFEAHILSPSEIYDMLNFFKNASPELKNAVFLVMKSAQVTEAEDKDKP